jgi:integrase
MSRVPAGTIPDKRKRAPKVKLGRRILGHLRRWKQVDARRSNRPLYELTVCHRYGAEIAKGRTAWERTVKDAGLPLSGRDKVTRHTLRHTTATWLLQKGIDLWTVAGFLGMSVKTLERVYGHHCPDYQELAANAL